MAHLETVSASECSPFCPCPLKRLMNDFCAGVKPGVCPRVAAAPSQGRFGCRDQLTGAEAAGGAFPAPPPPAQTEACRPVNAAVPSQSPWGLGAPGSLLNGRGLGSEL